MAREINLVPDIKDEMIKALKLRNLIFYICMIVAIGSVSITFIFGVIAGGQLLARDGKKAFIDDLSRKVNSYTDLNDNLTIKDQVGNIDLLTNKKQVFSRTFNALAAMIPTGADSIMISELGVDLGNGEEGIGQPTFTLEAQANAGQKPFIDYNVLDSFKKSMQYMRYDYGDYVDKEGKTIPAYCMIEQGDDGATFKESVGGKDNYYAYWTINATGCNPTAKLKAEDYGTAMTEYNNQTVVKIWRTPQFGAWYKETPINGEPSMSLDGTISDVEHFESKCIVYKGEDSGSNVAPKWVSENNCRLVVDKTGETSGENEGIVGDIESSNGRDSNGELVLRFNMTIRIAPEFYQFTNYHMMAIAPSGRRNVTDSYAQVQAMFGERANDCSKDDADCKSTENSTGDDDSSSDKSSNKTSDSSSRTVNINNINTDDNSNSDSSERSESTNNTGD